MKTFSALVKLVHVTDDYRVEKHTVSVINVSVIREKHGYYNHRKQLRFFLKFVYLKNVKTFIKISKILNVGRFSF